MGLSFTNWDADRWPRGAKFVGLQNYRDIVGIYPPFWPAVQRDLISLVVMFFIATPSSACSSPCCSTASCAGRRVYQTAIYLPVVLSLALVGFIWQLIYSKDQGFINGGHRQHRRLVGDPEVRPVGRARRLELGGTSATSCCST